MASYRLPGPVCGETQAVNTADGTSCPWASAAPGPLDGAGRGWAQELDPRTLWRRLAAVREALSRAEAEVPAAVWRETMCDISALLRGLWPALQMALGVLGLSAVLGGAVGAAFGAFAGGVGAVPGGVAGASTGLELGMAVLAWLGLAALVEPAARGLGELAAGLREATVTAWEAYGRADRDEQVQRAALGYAQCVAVLMRLVLMGIVARLSVKPTVGVTTRAASRAAAAGDAAQAGESVASLVATLRESRFGRPFADWVEAHSQELLRNPRLQAPAPALRPASSSGGAPVTPSQLRQGAGPAAPAAAERAAIAGESTARKGVFGEHHADAWMEQHGFKKLNGEPTRLDDAPRGKGIDGVWRNDHPPPEFVITEAKYGSADLGKLTDGTRQMSDKWIDRNLRKELDKATVKQIRDAEARGQVEKWLIKVDENGAIKRQLLTETSPNKITRTPLPDGFP